LNIANIRLISQQIALTKYKTAQEIVNFMGAMQAQDFAMVKWAIGLRLKNSTNKIIETAINKGEIIRTHLLRPTWHFVSAEDIHWLIELTAPKIKSSIKSRLKEFEINEKMLAQSNAIFHKALIEESFLSREDLLKKLTDAKIPIDNFRSSHFLFCAELDGLICSGPIKNNKQTYSLLEKRVPKYQSFSREESLAKLATKYFFSHFPATVQDFIWWSGLGATDAKNALESIKHSLFFIKIF